MINSNNIQQAVPSVVDIIYESLKDLNKSSTKAQIVEKLNEISFLKDSDPKTKRLINTFARKIKNRMVDGKNPQQAFKIIKEYEPNFFWRVIYWFASILNIDTEKSVFNSILSKSSELFNKINTNESTLDSSDEKDNVNQINSIVNKINTNECVLSPEDIAINNLFRKYLLINGSDWTVLHDQINKGVNDINKMVDSQQNQFFVKELTANNGWYKPTEEVSRAAMMRLYSGKDKSTQYMIMHKDNKQYVASKEVANSMTLKQYIEKQQPEIDEEQYLQTFKDKFIDKYARLAYHKKISILDIWKQESYDVYIEKCKSIISDKYDLQRRILHSSNPEYNNEDAKIGKIIFDKKNIFDKYPEFFIEKIIEDIEYYNNYRSTWLYHKNPMAYDDIRKFIAKSCNLKPELQLTDQDKENIRNFCNENLDLIFIACIQDINKDIYMTSSIQILEALGGPNSHLVEEYIKLQQANFAVGNKDGHANNILVKLDEEGKAQGLVAIDFDNTSSRSGLNQYNSLKEVLDCVEPGMVQRIEDEFKQSMQQPRKLHDLAKLLGAKEEEYRMLNNIEVSSTKFQDMINRAMNEGAVLNR